MRVQGHSSTLMHPSRACLTLAHCEDWTVLIGGENKGKVRIAPLPFPHGRAFQVGGASGWGRRSGGGERLGQTGALEEWLGHFGERNRPPRVQRQ